eukprot:5616058-Prymnesium_polylepis.1
MLSVSSYAAARSRRLPAERTRGMSSVSSPATCPPVEESRSQGLLEETTSAFDTDQLARFS